MLVLVLLAQAVGFAVSKSNVYDEPIDIAAGYVYLRTGDYHLCPEHPALATALTAAPLLLLDLRDPAEDPDLRADRRWELSIRMLHRNEVPAEAILLLARAPSILLLGGFAVFLYLFAARELGGWGGAATVSLLATSPTWIAHGSLATTDSFVAVFAASAALALIRLFETWRVGWLVAAGLLVGAALASKMTALLLLPVAAGIAWLGEPPPPESPIGRLVRMEGAPGRRHGARALALAAVVALALAFLWIVYAWRAVADPALEVGTLHDPATLEPRGGVLGALFDAGARLVPEEYAYGLREMWNASGKGWPGYLLGERFEHAPWWAYTAAALCKTRALVLGGLVVALVCWTRLGLGGRRLVRLGLLPVLLLLLLSAGSGYKGVRILMMACPFVFLIIGGVAARLAERGGRPAVLVAVLVFLAGLEGLVAFPDYLAYQNVLAGSGATAHERLVDSDLDWGQDLPALAEEVRRLGDPPLHLRYFGTGDYGAYGMKIARLPEGRPVSGVVAVSATYLQGLYLEDPEGYAWLRGREPIARAGKSILIYRIP